jgi:hypothetical protein
MGDRPKAAANRAANADRLIDAISASDATV